MNEKMLQEVAFANLPNQNCPLTGNPISNPAVMHRDLSDWWPSSLHDMRDDRLANLMIVEHDARDRYYAKLKNMGIVLALSGGLDSTTVLHWCMRVFGKVHCLLFDYGQRHKIELESAIAYLNSLGTGVAGSGYGICVGDDPVNDPSITWQKVDMSPINQLANSALTREDIKPARNTPIEEMASGALPATYVPGRNVYFMTALAQAAYQRGWRHIALGVNVLDYSGYPDCRPEFVAAMRKALSIGVFNGVDIGVHAPLMLLNKKHIIRLGTELGVKYEHTHSCYNGIPGGCGECDSCQLRRRAFIDLGMVDPAIKSNNL